MTKPATSARDLYGPPTAAPAARVRRAVEGWTTAADVIGPLTADTCLFALTRGQISMVDVVRHCVEDLHTAARGPIHASIWTWCIAEYEVESFEWFLSTSRLLSATLVIDHSAEQRNVSLIDRWRDAYGDESVRVCRNHAKVATVTDGTLRIAARGSMNLNLNPRFEQFDVSANDGVYDLLRQAERDLPVLPRLASHREAGAASRITEAFSGQALAPFAGVKTWAK